MKINCKITLRAEFKIYISNHEVNREYNGLMWVLGIERLRGQKIGRLES